MKDKILRQPYAKMTELTEGTYKHIPTSFQDVCECGHNAGLHRDIGTGYKGMGNCIHAGCTCESFWANDRCVTCGAKLETHMQDHLCRMHRNEHGICEVCGNNPVICS